MNLSTRIVLIGGTLTLRDGRTIDSRFPSTDTHADRAVHRALATSTEWWTIAASIAKASLRAESTQGFVVVVGGTSRLWRNNSTGTTTFKSILRDHLGTIEVERSGINQHLPSTHTITATLDEGVLGEVGYVRKRPRRTFNKITGSEFYFPLIFPFLAAHVMIDSTVATHPPTMVRLDRRQTNTAPTNRPSQHHDPPRHTNNPTRNISTYIPIKRNASHRTRPGQRPDSRASGNSKSLRHHRILFQRDRTRPVRPRSRPTSPAVTLRPQTRSLGPCTQPGPPPSTRKATTRLQTIRRNVCANPEPNRRSDQYPRKETPRPQRRERQTRTRHHRSCKHPPHRARTTRLAKDLVLLAPVTAHQSRTNMDVVTVHIQNRMPGRSTLCAVQPDEVSRIHRNPSSTSEAPTKRITRNTLRSNSWIQRNHRTTPDSRRNDQEPGFGIAGRSQQLSPNPPPQIAS
jgi:hypothetical protein